MYLPLNIAKIGVIASALEEPQEEPQNKILIFKIRNLLIIL